MTALVLGAIALAAVVLSFSLVVLTLYRVVPNTAQAQASNEDPGGAAATMSRVLGDVERLAALRDRGALTDAEFKAQKANVLHPAPSGTAKGPGRPGRGDR